jgi:O-antigen ligase
MKNQVLKSSLSLFPAILLAIIPLVQTKQIPDPTLLSRQFLLLAFGASLWLNLVIHYQTARQIIAQELLIPLLGLAGIYLLSAHFSFNHSEADYSVTKMLLYLSITLLMIWLINQNLLQKEFLLYGIAFASALGLFLLIQEINHLSAKGTQLWSQKNLYELKSAFGHKNLYSSFQLLCLPFLFLLFFSSKTWLRWLISILILAIVLSIFLVQTKAVLLAIFLTAFLLLFMATALGVFGSKRIKYLMIAGFSVVTLIAFASIFLFPEKLLLLRSNDTVVERYLLWTNSWQMLKEFPLLGVGPGNWQVYFPKYGLGNFIQTNYLISDGFLTFQRPHNDFLWVACEAGLLGFFLYLFIFGYILRQCWIGIKKNEKEAWIIGAGIMAYLVVAAVDFPLERNEHQLLLAILIAFAYKKEIQSQQKISLVLIVLVFIGLGYSFWFGLNRFAQEKEAKKMIESYRSGNYNNLLKYAQNIDQSYLSMDNYSIPVDWYKGLTLYSLGRKDLALIANQKAYAVNPFQIHVINNLAGMHHENDSLEVALKLYNEVLQISPTQPDALLNKCAVLYNLGQTKMAFETLYLFKYDDENQQFQQSLAQIGKSYFEEKLQKEPNEIQLKQWFLTSKKKGYTFEEAIIHQP